MGGDKAKSYDESMYEHKARRMKSILKVYSDNNHYFSSQVERFKPNNKNANPVGPGNYDSSNSGFERESFNRKKDLYTGSRQPRFDNTKIRPNLGPGAYFNEEALKK